MRYGSFFLVLLLFCRCTKNDIPFGTELVENGYTNIVMVDTLLPEVTTVYRDSFPTSGTGILFAGRCVDPLFGTVSAAAYLQLAPPAFIDIPATSGFDSLVLLIEDTLRIYGDTTAPIPVVVHQLSQRITLPSGLNRIYNRHAVPVEPVAIGSGSVLLRPGSGQGFSLRLSDALGQLLFTRYQAKDADLASEAAFLEYFHGLRISGPAARGLIGFEASGLRMRLYYHEVGVFNESKSVDFLFTGQDLAFSRIDADRSGTLLASLPGADREVPSAQLGKQAFFQPMTGLSVKIRFPSLRDLLLQPDFVKVVKAELLLRPARGSYTSSLPLPPEISLATTDASNEVLSFLGYSSGSNFIYYTGDLSVDAVFGESTRYQYDVTSHIQELINTPATNRYGFLLSLVNTSANNTFLRAVFNDGTLNPKLQLRLYYVSVK